MVAFADLAEFWGDLMDGISGRTNTLYGSPSTTADWGNTLIASLYKAAGTVNIVVNGPAGYIDATCPDPGDDMAAFRAINLLPKWRRLPILCFGSEGPGASLEDMVFYARTNLASVVFPSVRYYVGYSDYDLAVTSELNVLFIRGRLFANAVSTRTFPSFSAGPVPDTNTLDSAPDVVFDVCGTVYIFGNSGLGLLISTPSSPDAQEPLASALQFPGEGEIFVEGDDIAALNNLADALSRGTGLEGTVQTHRSRNLLTVSSGSTLLPKATGTSDNMMHRLAQAIRCWLGGSLALPTTGKKALVGLNRAILVKRK